MFKSFVICTAVLLSAPAAAQSPFDGTWKTDFAASSVDAKPNTFTLAKGTYSCASCLPPYSVKADGAFHPVKDRPYWDEVAIKAADARTVSYRYRKGGREVAQTVFALSPDGNTLAVANKNTNNGAGAPIETNLQWTRIAPAPAGAHAVSGSWKPAPPTNASDAATTFEIRVVGDHLTLKSPGMGESLDADFGGPFVVNAGDPGKTMTRAERVSPTSIRLTDMQLGKVTQIATYTVAPDGATITGEWVDPRDGSKGTFVARKQ